MSAARSPEAHVDPIFLERWSRRAFSPRAIPAELVSSLFEAARWAPSASNAQPWLFIFNDDAETLGRTRPILNERNRQWAERAPLLIFVFARRNHPETGRPLRTGAFDTGAAWLSLALQAHKLGLAARAMGGIDHDAAHAVLGVPRELYESMAAVAVGYPGSPEDLPSEVAAREAPNGRRSTRTFVFKGRFPVTEHQSWATE
ncbi:MAG TPA: nitroreductase family protein [Polyangia bacterium]|nr:nitroreductase family protein [Polyangia bacterium]